MRPITFVEEWDPAIRDRVRTRYAREVDALGDLAFRELACYSELLGNYSLLTGLPMVILMRFKREVLSWRPHLQVGAWQPGSRSRPPRARGTVHSRS